MKKVLKRIEEKKCIITITLGFVPINNLSKIKMSKKCIDTIDHKLVTVDWVSRLCSVLLDQAVELLFLGRDVFYELVALVLIPQLH